MLRNEMPDAGHVTDDGFPMEISEIEPAKARRKRANIRTTPNKETPASNPIPAVSRGDDDHLQFDTQEVHAVVANTENGPEKVRRKRAIFMLAPNAHAPASANTEIGSRDASGNDGAMEGTTTITRAPHIPNIVTELADLQRLRLFCIKQNSQSERSIEALIASTMGYRNDASEKDREALFARAKVCRLSVERDPEDRFKVEATLSMALLRILPMIKLSALSRAPWDKLRGDTEAKMVKLAMTLPVYRWTKTVKGFGEKGLAIVCGEANIPVGDYRTIEGLWSRMGLGVFNGRRQQLSTNSLDLMRPDGTPSGKYTPKRRAEIWTLADSMFKHQWAGDKDEDRKDPKKTGKPVAVPAHPTGPYGEVYAARKAHTFPRIEATADLPTKIGAHVNPDKWTRRRCDNDARRIMVKALLRDLWRVWRGLPPRGSEESPFSVAQSQLTGATPR